MGSQIPALAPEAGFFLSRSANTMDEKKRNSAGDEPWTYPGSASQDDEFQPVPKVVEKETKKDVK